MRITKQRELRVLAEIAKKSGNSRYELDYIYFFNGHAFATDSRLLAILPNCWTPDDNDPEKVWLKIDPAKVNNKLQNIIFKAGDKKAIVNGNIVIDIKNESEIAYPRVEKIIPDFMDTHSELSPFGYMGAATTWIISKLDFIPASLLWYSVPGKRIAYLDTGESSLIIIGYGFDLRDNLETIQIRIHDKSKKALSLFSSPIQSNESTNVNVVSIPVKKECTFPDNSDEKIVFDILQSDPIHIDLICSQLQWPVHRVSSALGLLEFKNYCVRESGMRFKKAE